MVLLIDIDDSAVNLPFAENTVFQQSFYMSFEDINNQTCLTNAGGVSLHVYLHMCTGDSQRPCSLK